MIGRRAALLGASLLLVAGCGTSTPDAAAEVTPPATAASASPSPVGAAARVLAALQASVADLGAVEVSGGTPGSLTGGTIRAASDLRTGEFRVTVDLGDGSGKLGMIRQSDLTWTKAPPSFWVRLGYTAASAREVQGKWVVARAKDIRPLVESLDPGVAVRGLLQLRAEDVVSLDTVRDGPLRGRRVLRFRQGGEKQSVYLTSGTTPRLVRISSTTGGRRTDLDFVGFPDQFRVSLPPASDVFAPR